MSRKHALIAYLSITAVVIGLDLWTKRAAFDYLDAHVEFAVTVEEFGARKTLYFPDETAYRAFLVEKGVDDETEPVGHLVHGTALVHRDGSGRLIEGRERPVFESWFALEASLNKGAYNGWFYGQRTLLLSISVLWVLGTLIWVVWRPRQERLLVIAIALTAGGAFGNLWDRYFHAAVRDFIKWFIVWDGEAMVWPNFNIADSAICVGVGLILVREFREARAAKRAKQAEAESEPEAEAEPSQAD